MKPKNLIALAAFCVASILSAKIPGISENTTNQPWWYKDITERGESFYTNDEFQRLVKNLKFGVADSDLQVNGNYALGQLGKIQAPNNWTQLENKLCVNPIGEGAGRISRDLTESDLKLIAESGVDRYRFSIAWSKVQPHEDQFDETMLAYYEAVAVRLKELDVEPVVMLMHHEWPKWFDEKGGFENPENQKFFVKYAKTIGNRLKGKVAHIMTLNEPEGYAFEGWLRGHYPPAKKGNGNIGLVGHVIKNMLDAHAAAYDALKTIDPNFKISYAQAVQPIVPVRYWDGISPMVAALFNRLLNNVTPEYLRTGSFNWLPFMKFEQNPNVIGKLDFVAINYYTRTTLGLYADGRKFLGEVKHNPKHVWVTDSGKEIYPEGLYAIVKKYHVLFPKLPIHVTENGIADKNDTENRDLFYKAHLVALERAINEGVPVEAYDMWASMDTAGWTNGAPTKTSPGARYGLYKVDFERGTLERTLRKSALPLVNFMRSRKGMASIDINSLK